MDHPESDDLPPTLPYDPHESQFSNEAIFTPATILSPPNGPPTTEDPTAPHSGSSFNSLNPIFPSSDSYTTDYDNSGDSSGSQKTLLAMEEERMRNLIYPLPQDECNRIKSEADQRLYRTRSANPTHDDTGFFTENKKRKRGSTTSEEAIQQHNLTRGLTDLTSFTSNWDNLSHYSDIIRLRGKIDPRQRAYLIEKFDVANLIASMDTNSISSSNDKTQHFSGNTSLDSCPADISTSFVSNSSTSESTTSQAVSTQSLPSIPETSLPAATSTAPESTSPIQQSTCPINDFDVKNSMENDGDDDNDKHHLNDYSPGQKDDFAQQVSLQPSSTPIRPHIPSSFPEDDFATLKETTEEHATDDFYTTPPRKQQFWPTSSSSSSFTSPVNRTPPSFIEDHHHQQQHNRRPVASSLRRLRSNSSLFDASVTSPSPSHSPPPCIMFTSTVNDQKYRRVAKSMGATIVSSWELCTHMVTDTFRRTPNLLCALATQKFIVSEEWIKASVSSGLFEDASSYVLVRQNPPNHFAGKTLFFTAKANIKRTDATDLAKAAGARVRLRQPDLEKSDESLVVVGADDEDARPFEGAGYEVIPRDRFLELYAQLV